MEIEVRGKRLKFSMPEDERVTREAGTPYWEEFKTKSREPGSDFYKRLYFQQKIADMLKGEYDSYMEPMAGLGIIASMFECDDMELNDWDMYCRRALRDNFPYALVTRQDINDFEPFQRADVTFIDFNNFTVKRFADNTDGLKDQFIKFLNNTDKYFIFNDSTPFYLRYGKKSYENVRKVMRVREDETMTRIEDYPHHLSWFLMREVDKPLKWEITNTFYFGAMAYHIIAKSGFMNSGIQMHRVPEDYKSQLEFKII